MIVPDVKRLAAEISVQHGIRVDPDDPMMAVVTLNRLVLEQVAADIVERLQSAGREIQDAAEKVQLRAGSHLAREVRECASAIRQEMIESARPTANQAATEMGRANPLLPRGRSLAVDVFLALVIFLSGFVLGNAVRGV
jgi:Transcriptional activator TraM